jgi:hypothetical protein
MAQQLFVGPACLLVLRRRDLRDPMGSHEIKKMRYPIRRDEISDEIGWDLMRSDEISALLRSFDSASITTQRRVKK